ncbi:MAG: hypothetical protein GXX99_04210 [Clostridiales bacterium]|nr:hypothetical protein [Clostridiales bacterium]
MDKKNRGLALLAAAAMTVGLLAGCNKSEFPKEPAVTKGEVSISAEAFYDYFSALAIQEENGLNRRFEDFQQEALPYSEEEGETYRTYLVDNAVYHSINEAFLLSLYAQRGLELGEAELADVQSEIDYYVQSSGGREAYVRNIINYGMTVQFFEENIRNSHRIEQLLADMRGEEGLTEQDVMDQFRQDFRRVKQILIKTIDDNYEALPAEEVAAKTALKDDVLKQLEAGADFDALLAAHNEDPGMASLPDGYVIDRAIGFDQSFKDVAFSLEEGDFGVGEGHYGYYIIKRYPLREEDLQAEYADYYNQGTAEEVVFNGMVVKVITQLLETFNDGHEEQRNQQVIDQMVDRYLKNDSFQPEAAGEEGVDPSGIGLDDLLDEEQQEADADAGGS